jgi:hypothetical protein
MDLIGLEITDAGILAAGGTPARLLEIEREAIESPGFALPEKKRVTVGRAAEQKARLFPRQILNRFWDQLNTDPLDRTETPTLQNNAEIAYRHLALIWHKIRKYGNETVMAVPGFYDQTQLGLILGIARELEMPIKGFVPIALAASSVYCPEKMLLHLDIHLHRIEIIYLEQTENLTLRDAVTTGNKGLTHLYQEWVDAIAREFVRTTRFDPLHRAASEQELYDRLPEVLSHFVHHPSMVFEMTGESTPFFITLERELITGRAESVYREICGLVEKMRKKHGNDEKPVALQLSRRLIDLPGCKERLAEIKDAQIIGLDRGAAACGVAGIWDHLAVQNPGRGTAFFSSRPWQPPRRAFDDVPSPEKAAGTHPTHLLYRSIAYPINKNPLTIGYAGNIREQGVQVYGRAEGVSPRLCTIERRGREVVLNDHSTDGTFVDETPVNGSVVLKLGQMIRTGSSGEKLQLISCINSDETQ